jgi:hypothetical protein
MIFQIFRHHNNVLVEQFLNHLHQGLDPSKDLSRDQSVNPQHLKTMYTFAQMRQAADNAAMGFAATFITETGYHYTNTNLPGVGEEDSVLQYLLSIPFGEEVTEGCLRLVETQDGVQLQIVEDAQ